MSQVSHPLNTPFAVIAHHWNGWKAAYDRAVTNYYNQRIERHPEAEAREYWARLSHPQSGIKLHEVTDQMLSRLMNRLIEQGLSKFAADCFILELRRLRRTL